MIINRYIRGRIDKRKNYIFSQMLDSIFIEFSFILDKSIHNDIPFFLLCIFHLFYDKSFGRYKNWGRKPCNDTHLYVPANRYRPYPPPKTVFL